MLYIVDMVQSWGQATMHRKHFVVHHGSNWKVVKHISEQLPHLRITILLLALSVESIDLRDCPSLMVAPDQAYSIWVSQFKNHQKGNCLNTMRSSINIVAHEQVVSVRSVVSPAFSAVFSYRIRTAFVWAVLIFSALLPQ